MMETHEEIGECLCGRPVAGGWPLHHSDGGDPWYCYPEESVLSIESRCTVELDIYGDDSEE